jgi:periplasmic divalent cation tolerance protein
VGAIYGLAASGSCFSEVQGATTRFFHGRKGKGTKNLPPKKTKYNKNLTLPTKLRHPHMPTTYLLILVTTSSKQEAEKISQTLLKTKLIACANIIGPISSHFHWKGKTEQAEEFLILMKSRLDLFDAVSEQVKALHSYEIPEVVALPIVAGSKAYLEWLGMSLQP